MSTGVFAGSVFVSRRARAFLEGMLFLYKALVHHANATSIDKLRTSKYGSPDSLDHITKRFDETTKRLFRDNKELQFVPFGSPLDKDLPVGIRGGQLKLTGCVSSTCCPYARDSVLLSIGLRSPRFLNLQ